MATEKDFGELRGRILQEIASAASRGETVKVGALARLLADCERALPLASSLTNAAERIERELSHLGDLGNASESLEMRSRPSLPLSPKSIRPRDTEHEEEVRKKLLDDLAEKYGPVRRISKKICQTRDGRIIGFPYAKEAPALRNPWWLGLPDQHFDSVVLLCEESSGQVLRFFLSADFVKHIWPRLSRESSRPQVKFNVRRELGNYVLAILGGELIDITLYLA